MSVLDKYLEDSKKAMSSIYGYTNESVIKDDKDIYYNKEKFMNGDINLCFITGFAGSGKSTMGSGMEKYHIEHYDLDDVQQNYDFSNDNLKEYGDLIYSFFLKGPGRPYRYYSFEDMANCTNPDDKSGDKFDEILTKTFVDYAIQYAKSHKNKRFVLEGIWIYLFIEPSKLKDYAVYIKGTSLAKSAWRASNRDAKNEKLKGAEYIRSVTKSFTYRIKETIKRQAKNYNRFKEYYEKLEKESNSRG